jgi:hypothetical protein
MCLIAATGIQKRAGARGWQVRKMKFGAEIALRRFDSAPGDFTVRA